MCTLPRLLGQAVLRKAPAWLSPAITPLWWRVVRALSDDLQASLATQDGVGVRLSQPTVSQTQPESQPVTREYRFLSCRVRWKRSPALQARGVTEMSQMSSPRCQSASARDWARPWSAVLLASLFTTTFCVKVKFLSASNV